MASDRRMSQAAQTGVRQRADSKRRKSTAETQRRRTSSSTESPTGSVTRSAKGPGRIFGIGEIHPTKWLVFSESETQDFQWEYSYHYFLGLLSCTVSLNDLAKFPEKCIKHGGVWFLGVHILFTIIFAFPFFVVENLLGQCSGATAMQAVNNICPIFGGFGLAIMVTRMVELVELSTWLSWNWLYFCASFTPILPWESCGHQWNNRSCFTLKQQEDCAIIKRIFWNLTCITPKEFCLYFNYSRVVNSTHCANGPDIVAMTSIETRFGPGQQFMLYITENPIDFDEISDVYHLVTYTMFWVFYYLCIWNGMKSTVRVTHITMTYTFLAFLVLVSGTFLAEGSFDGIKKHMIQSVDKILEINAWDAALRSSLDTLSLGFAINFMYAKFNKYSYNFMRPLTLVVIIDILFCIIFSFTVSAFLGMAEMKEAGAYFSTEGITLVMDSVPRIFQYFPSPNVFSAIFYLFCVSISVEIGFVLLETILISVIHIAPKIRNYKKYVRMGVCFSQWCIGLFFFTEPGLHVMENVKMCNNLDSDFLFGIEAILITWLYGFTGSIKWKHFHDFKDMFGYLPKYHYYLKFGFYVTAPVCSVVYTITRFTSFELPQETEIWAWMIYAFLLLRSPCILVCYGIYKMREYRKKRKPIWHLLLPERDWVPED